ncbi:MAG: hypothetical protein M5U19_13170 [Microthrixaceae bacterium]|nr:hypothetical protein [Microthrixaceae bacterium]
MRDRSSCEGDVDPPVGFAVIDKPSGWTSHDVVAKSRGVFGTRKVGHSGTLDPAATGVLVLGVGRATKLLRYLSGLPKTYEATITLGVETDTLDADGGGDADPRDGGSLHRGGRCRRTADDR